MKLNLIRPLVCFDLETTGVNSQTDRIVEYAFVKVYPDGSRDSLCNLINPEMPIPAGATAVHGIEDQDVSDSPTFHEDAAKVINFIFGCDLAGFNLLAFDIPLLYHEFNRAGISWDHLAHHIVDAGNLFKIMEPRTLEAAVKLYAGRDHNTAHEAMGDAEATIDVLAGQLDRYQGLPATVEELALHTNHGRKRADVTGKFIVNEQGEYVLNFGQNRGQLARDNPSFLNWVLQRDFPGDVHAICREILYPVRPANSPSMVNNPDDDLPF